MPDEKNRGRLSVCKNGKARRFTFQLCPDVKEELNLFCTTTEGERLKSRVINRAIMEYIERERAKDEQLS